ncbi:MAG: hypothetical protein ACYCPO_15940, partial [Acidobacteriaceae bacterium]
SASWPVNQQEQEPTTLRNGILQKTSDLTPQWAMSADYIRKISQVNASTLFTVDDISGGFASPRSIAKFAGYTGHIVRLDDVVPAFFSKCSGQPEISVTDLKPKHAIIVSDMSASCGAYAFNGAALRYIPPEVYSTIRRTPEGSFAYAFPHTSGRLSIHLNDIPANSEILIADMGQQTYRKLSIGSQPAP